MQGALNHSDGSTRTSPIQRASSGEKSKSAGISAAEATLTKNTPASSGFCFSSFGARAVMRLMARGSPDVRGVMASMCTPCASSAMPMISAPKSRESITRIKSPKARTTALTPVRNTVCFFAPTAFIAFASTEQGMRRCAGA